MVAHQGAPWPSLYRTSAEVTHFLGSPCAVFVRSSLGYGGHAGLASSVAVVFRGNPGACVAVASRGQTGGLRCLNNDIRVDVTEVGRTGGPTRLCTGKALAHCIVACSLHM